MTAAQAIRARKKAKLDPRYSGLKTKDAETQRRKLKMKLDKLNKMSQRKGAKK